MILRLNMVLKLRFWLYMKNTSLKSDSIETAVRLNLENAIAIDEAAWLDEIHAATGNKPRDVLVQYLSIGVVIID